MSVKDCTGVAANWCPIHGDCTCADPDDKNDLDCPLHSPDCDHAKPDSEERLLADVADDPGCPAPKLILADWYEEHGDDQRAKHWRDNAEDMSVPSCPIIDRIKKIGVGVHKCPTGGWIGVTLDDDEKDEYSVLWTSHEESHFPLIAHESAIAGDFSPHKTKAIYKTAVSLWRVHDEDEAKKIETLLVQRITAIADDFIRQSLDAAARNLASENNAIRNQLAELNDNVESLTVPEQGDFFGFVIVLTFAVACMGLAFIPVVMSGILAFGAALAILACLFSWLLFASGGTRR